MSSRLQNSFLNRWIPRLGKIMPWVVGLSTFLVFSGALRNGFVNWDDNVNFLANPHYRGFSWPNLRWMFMSTPNATFDPLFWIVTAATYALWGMNPLGYHLTGVLLHAAVAVVFYHTAVCLLKSAGAGRDGESDAALRCSAGMAALLFALHPLRVEAVVWLSGRHHVQGSLFFLLSIWSYLKSREALPKSSGAWLAASLFSYVLSLLSGPIAVTLPVVLLILDVYLASGQNGGLEKIDARAILLKKTPYFILAVLSGLATGLLRAPGFTSIAKHGVKDRIFQALFGLAFYVWKTAAPFRISPLYPMPDKINPLSWPFLLSGCFVVLTTFVVFALRRRWPAGLAVWAYYVVTLFPVSGIAQFGPQIAADRYSYLSSFGFAVLAAGGLARLWKERGPRIWGGSALIAGTVIAALSFLTWRQTKAWYDSESLWRQALSTNTDNYGAHYNLGLVLDAQGKKEEAAEEYARAISAKPDFAPAHYNLGLEFAGRGKITEAIRQYESAIQSEPDFIGARYNLGLLLAGQGRRDEAIKEYSLAVLTKPDFVEAQFSLGLELAAQGKFDEAIPHYERALQDKPEFTAARTSLGTALAGQGRLDEALRQFNLALRENPNSPTVHNDVGFGLAALGKTGEAIKQYELALQEMPKYGRAQLNLGAALWKLGRTEEARTHFEAALAASRPVDSDEQRLVCVDANIDIGSYELTRDRVAAAEAHYREALRLDPNSVLALFGLKSALAAHGR